MLKNTLQKNLENVYIKRQFNYEFKYNAFELFIIKKILYLNKRSNHKNDDP